jgi:hypothetical protein
MDSIIDERHAVDEVIDAFELGKLAVIRILAVQKIDKLPQATARCGTVTSLNLVHHFWRNKTLAPGMSRRFSKAKHRRSHDSCDSGPQTMPMLAQTAGAAN